ncbi:SMP-30/gluconolactonase/LRE family protein [Sphingomonas quercus]|uniref:SMP-30/gluconolactonase/LRE family protein n=1 Tax=Sphingomonas quercus TaxID=2842451 RepID=A0ABS6BHX6_9SPHN|nr:SMP-30/gluconolactonase/LRE family protein [Sphingomonas quercus]MBU3077903.1 SMP-30/gluconolactonase/LRE family protein [Sphingomonas quercus]
MGRILAAALAVSSIAFVAGCSQTGGGADNGQENAQADAAEAQAEQGPHIDRLDPALDAIIPKDARLEKIGEGFGFAEGPLWVNGELRFSDLIRNKLFAIGPDGKTRLLLDKSGGLDSFPEGKFQGSNGAVVDKDGTVLMVQHGARRIVRLDDKLNIKPFIERFEGKRLNSPNDLVFAPDGSLWITDPPYGLDGQDKDPAKEVKFNAVYRYKDGKLTAVITDLPRPNGIGFSPDGKKLYISNSEPEMFVNVYDVNPDGTVANGKRFISYPGPNPIDVPDGLKVDSQGNVWTSGPGGIRIISPEGKVLGQLKTSDRAQANLAWGGPDWKTAYIMGAGNIYRLQISIPGEKPLYTK